MVGIGPLIITWDNLNGCPGTNIYYPIHLFYLTWFIRISAIANTKNEFMYHVETKIFYLLKATLGAVKAGCNRFFFSLKDNVSLHPNALQSAKQIDLATHMWAVKTHQKPVYRACPGSTQFARWVSTIRKRRSLINIQSSTGQEMPVAIPIMTQMNSELVGVHCF